MSEGKRVRAISAATSNTRATTPRLIWIDQVLAAAAVDVADMEQHCGRERLNRWCSDDMPVWMAADSLRAFVDGGKRAEREHQETDYLASKMKVNYE